jgi:hypothetical protein
VTRVAVLDDYQGVALGLADWTALGPDADINVFRRHVQPDEAAVALAEFDVLCLMREGG